MRRPLIAGNWKMNLSRSEAEALAWAVADGARNLSGIDVAVFPPAVYLGVVAEKLAGSAVGYGAQNVFYEPKGAFTGEISCGMLADLGCRWVLLGHSERRHLLGETDAQVNRKVRAALAAGLLPVVCLGELLPQRESGQTADVVRSQFFGSLAGLGAEEMSRITLAYEPVWAIGTGKVATPQQAQAVHHDLRNLIASRYNTDTAEATRILYGGSVQLGNAADLLSQPDVDGLLIGGASLKALEFVGICRIAAGEEPRD